MNTCLNSRCGLLIRLRALLYRMTSSHFRNSVMAGWSRVKRAMLSPVPRVLPGTTIINLVLSNTQCFGRALGVVPWGSCLGGRALEVVPWSCLGGRALGVVPWSCLGGRALGVVPWSCLRGRSLVVPLSRCDFLLAVYIAEYGIFTLVCFS